MNPAHNLKRGFTLIEMIIVVIIIALLIVVVAAGYGAVQRNARDKTVLSDADALDGIQTQYSIKNATGGKDWYSGPSGTNGAVDQDLGFVPTSGNIIDVVTSTTDYCIRVYNPSSATYKILASAYIKESTPGVCANLASSSEAQLDSN